MFMNFLRSVASPKAKPSSKNNQSPPKKAVAFFFYFSETRTFPDFRSPFGSSWNVHHGFQPLNSLGLWWLIAWTQPSMKVMSGDFSRKQPFCYVLVCLFSNNMEVLIGLWKRLHKMKHRIFSGLIRRNMGNSCKPCWNILSTWGIGCKLGLPERRIDGVDYLWAMWLNWWNSRKFWHRLVERAQSTTFKVVLHNGPWIFKLIRLQDQDSWAVAQVGSGRFEHPCNLQHLPRLRSRPHNFCICRKVLGWDFVSHFSDVPLSCRALLRCQGFVGILGESSLEGPTSKS